MNLGFIRKKDRTLLQQNAHDLAMSKCVKFKLPVPQLAKGDRVCLYDAWKAPDVVKDVGLTFSRIYQYTGSCLLPHEKVRMSDGSEKEIQSIVEGDSVVTHKGRVRKVTATMNRFYSGSFIKLKIKGYSIPLTVTEDHQVAVRSGDNDVLWKYANDLQVEDEVFIGWYRGDNAVEYIDCLSLLGNEAIDLNELMKDKAFTKDGLPKVPNSNVGSARLMVRQSGIDWKNKIRLRNSRVTNSIPRYIKVDKDFARFVGLYLAEGGYDDGRLTFTFNANEEYTLAAEVVSLSRSIFGAEAHISKQIGRDSVCKVRIPNINVSRVIKALIAGNVYSKRVPGILMHSNEDVRKAVFLGWMAGDGHAKTRSGINIVGISVCENLARDMHTLALSCGFRASLQTRPAYKQSKQAYAVALRGKAAAKQFAGTKDYADTYSPIPENNFTEFGYARPIQEITKYDDSTQVYDIEVDEDHSFIAEGIVVHNCVHAGGTNAVFSTIAMQRVSGAQKTKAFLPFTYHNYAASRHYMGEDGQGEGSLGSTFAKSLHEDGIWDWNNKGKLNLPQYTTSNGGNGIGTSHSTEMQWSSYRYPEVARVLKESKPHTFGTAAECKSVEDIQAMVLNGYGVTFACNYFIGNGSIVQSGDNSYVRGKWDSYGGHQQSIHAFWNHKLDGPLYYVLNNWASSTYVKDPAGGPICGVWVQERDVKSALSYDAEVFGLSHLNGFEPAPDVVVNWSTI